MKINYPRILYKIHFWPKLPNTTFLLYSTLNSHIHVKVNFLLHKSLWRILSKPSRKFHPWSFNLENSILYLYQVHIHKTEGLIRKKKILNWWSVNTFPVREKEEINRKHAYASQAHVSIIRNDNNFPLSATKIPFHITFLWGQGTRCLLCIAMYDFVWATVYREPNTYRVVHVHKHAFIFY